MNWTFLFLMHTVYTDMPRVWEFQFCDLEDHTFKNNTWGFVILVISKIGIAIELQNFEFCNYIQAYQMNFMLTNTILGK